MAKEIEATCPSSFLMGPQHTFTEEFNGVELEFAEQNILVERGSQECILLEHLNKDGQLYGGDRPMEVWLSGTILHARCSDERRSLAHLMDSETIRLVLPPSYTGYLRVEAHSGSVRIRGIHASSLRADVRSGSLIAESCSFSEKMELMSASGPVSTSDTDCPETEISSHSGTIRTERLICTALHIQSHSGAQKLNVSVKGEAILEAQSGSMHVTGDVRELRTETRSGSQKFDLNSLKNAHMKAKSGSLFLTVRKPQALRDINVETMSGTVHIFLPIEVRPVPHLETRSGMQHFTSADFSKTAGDVHIHASTLSGSLSIKPVQ